MLRNSGSHQPSVTITVNGSPHTVPAGVSVAAALFGLSDDRHFCRSRPENSGEDEPRGPYCLMGVCFDCLVEIDGVPDRQSCLAVVEEGMNIRVNKDERP